MQKKISLSPLYLQIPLSLAFNDLDRFHDIAFQDSVYVVHAFDDAGEDRVVVIESVVVDEVDENLTVSRITPARGYAQGSPDVRQEPELVSNVTRRADELVGAGASPLKHEVGNDPVEGQTVVITLLR